MTNEREPVFLTDSSALAMLQGTELTGVQVWKYGVALSFDNKPLTITIESNAEFRARGQTEIYNQEVIVAFGARMLSLVGQHVTTVGVTDGKVLALSFDEGSNLTLRPDSSGHESYSVNLPDGSIFVG
ncbi:MAG: DUF6188 family protein [Pseudorhodoplanes sp.]